MSDAVQFLRLYADRQHHGKEEDLLFPELGKKGMPAERLLSADEQARLFAEFEDVDKNKMGEGDRLLPFAERLTTEASRAIAS